MRRLHYLMAVAMCGLVVAMAGRTAHADETTASTLLRQAYLAVVDAEVAIAANRSADAISAYRKALDLYGRMQTEYPGWQTQVIDYRIADCRNQIAALESPVTANPDAVALTPPESPTNAEVRLKGLLDELRAMRPGLAAAPDGRVGDREWDRLRDERDEAVRMAQASQRKVERLEQQLQRERVSSKTSTAPSNAPLTVVPGVVKAELRRLLEAGNSAQALRLAREAAQLMPGEIDLVVLYGMAACQGAAFGEAVRVLQPYDTVTLRDAAVAVTLGSAYMGLGRLGDARIAMEKALTLNPKSADAHYNLAQILTALKPPELDLAEAHYMRALQLGSRPDPAFENALRTALLIARMKSKPHKTSTPVTPPTGPMTIPGAAPEK